ncbi:hypothetical protein R1sor_025884 [Riccia sorocarpa]|uniref:Plant heme peroxidase family profile domain-containing protein n=1 Tax=Riccia sorocarpa TaxID=122646 RepID=A0ABD3GB91_9MARC
MKKLDTVNAGCEIAGFHRSGSHTIGHIPCNGIGPTCKTTPANDTNPSLDPDFANSLKQICPKGNRLNIVDMDSSPNIFDTLCYQKALASQGNMTTDNDLIRGPSGFSTRTVSS